MSTSLKYIPITTIVRVNAKEGFEKQTLDWFYSISESATHFNGHLGSEIFKTCNDSSTRELVSIFHFDTYENLIKWESSEERNKQMESGKVFFEQVKPALQLTGLEFWFENTRQKNNNAAPSKLKMMVVTIVIIFTLLNTLIPLSQTLFSSIGLPELLKSLLNVIILVSLMSCLIMPLLTKLLSTWLFKTRNMQFSLK